MMSMIHAPRYVLPARPEARPVHTGVLVIGAGAAGLAAALTAAQHMQVTVLARTTLPESNSAWAQGGIAAALDAHDTPRAHVADTLVAGAGLADGGAVAALAEAAPSLMRELAALGVPFERTTSGSFALGLEGGHSQRRIVHVGDATGLAVIQVLLARVQAHPNITLFENAQAVDLLDDAGVISGALVHTPTGWLTIRADTTVLASGGAGALYGLTSNQSVALGEGIAMAYRAGAEVADMEFVQFHPTVYRTRAGQGFLITEAARGEGGILRDIHGERFMPAYDERAELAPRDIVTRGIYAAMRRTDATHVFLDLRHLPADQIEHHFPTICERLRADGIDPVSDLIPSAPAAHYLMGGVRTDLDGATNLPGLYAAGEVGCTGVHGANRLASNSLLECLVFGRRAGGAAAQRMQNAECRMQNSAAAQRVQNAECRMQRVEPRELPTILHSQFSILHSNWRSALASIMTASAGPLRDGAGLHAGLAQLADWPLQGAADDPETLTAANAALTARLIVASALLREESRGGHFRNDFPESRAVWRAHSVLQNGAVPWRVATLAPAWELAHAAD
jgi:L-aspartate oxidase